MTDWRLDETAHAGPEHLDPDFVAGYDRKQGHPSPQPDLDALRELGALGPTVVDLATGTGRFATAAAQFADRVVAVDVSPAMLAHLRPIAPPNVELVQSGFLSYEHTGAPADAVHTRNALHQLPDFWKGVALSRIAGTLRPGGILRLHDLVYDIDPSEAAGVFQDWFDGAATDPAEGYTAEDYAVHIRTEHSTYRWLLEPLLDRAGFDILDVAYDGRLYGAYTCRRRP
ncbi:MAG TPA: class I SAM-dependent methyltransferase [Mycobacteriales bacterium]|nr:class I SAM-dependent methyltransferase [Mycobacteriales bacterium]